VVHSLPDTDTALSQKSERAVAQEMTDQARKGQGMQALAFRVHRERQSACAQHITDFVVSGLVQRGFKANYHAILSEVELIGAHPATIRAEDFVVGSTDQRAPVLQDQRDTLALTPYHHLGLPRSAQPAIYGRRQEREPAGERHLLDTSRGTVSQQHRRALSDTGGTAKAHHVEAQRLQIRQQIGIVQVIDYRA